MIDLGPRCSGGTDVAGCDDEWCEGHGRRRPLLLDLFCCAGGASMGYHRAGFEVVGIDIKDQPHYPFAFTKGDALDPSVWLEATCGREPDVIHASPPCQRFSRARKVGTRKINEAPDLIGQTRELLQAYGEPYVIENVEGAPLFDPVRLCGSSFGLKVRRHRMFEISMPVDEPPACRHKEQGKPVGVYYVMGDQVQGVDRVTGRYVMGGRTASTLEEGQEAMGIDWMPWNQLKEALPPAYTEWVGGQVLARLGQ